MNLPENDQLILNLLQQGTDAADEDGENFDPDLVENLLDSVSAPAFTQAQLRSIALGASVVGLSAYLTPKIPWLLAKKCAVAAFGLAVIGGLLWFAHRPKPLAEGLQRYSTLPPEPVFVSSPLPVIDAPNVEPVPPTQSTFDAPPGLKNLALAASLSTSGKLTAAELKKIQDDQKGSDPAKDLVNLGSGPQQLTLDLGQECTLYQLVVWHRFDALLTYRDGLVEISPDASFSHSTVVYNNDHDNSLGRGAGVDHAYVETNFGRVISLGGKKARWVRIWSSGTQLSDENHYSEVQVWGN